MIRFIPHNDLVKPDPLLITTDDIKHGFIDKGIFMKGAIAISCGCNTATPTGDGTSSFAEVWKEYFGFAMAGARGRTDYKYIGTSDEEGDTPQLGTNASWVDPSSPVPSPLSPLLY